MCGRVVDLSGKPVEGEEGEKSDGLEETNGPELREERTDEEQPEKTQANFHKNNGAAQGDAQHPGDHEVAARERARRPGGEELLRMDGGIAGSRIDQQDQRKKESRERDSVEALNRKLPLVHGSLL